MPWIVDNDVPRQKAIKSQFYNAMVSRSVSRSEMLSSPQALVSMKKEWKGLWDQDVFDFARVVEYIMRLFLSTGPRMRKSNSHVSTAYMRREALSTPQR